MGLVPVYTCPLLRFTSISRFWEGKTGDLGDEGEKSQGKSSEKKQQYWHIIRIWIKHKDAHHMSVPLLITKFSIATTKDRLWPGIPISEYHLLFSLMTIEDPDFPMTVLIKQSHLNQTVCLGWDPEHQAGEYMTSPGVQCTQGVSYHTVGI